MSKQASNSDFMRATFIDGLHNSLKKQANAAIKDYKNQSKIAKSYLDDGLTESECIELLVIDGLERSAATSYTAMALNGMEESESPEYSFQFEENGAVWSSHDVGISITASTDEEAWSKAEEALNTLNLEAQRIISVAKIG
jgi:hypothetical protein